MMTKAQRDWHRRQCERYKSEIAKYQIYASTLEQVLRAVCDLYAPLGIVQVRAKTLSSFAEKMARKSAKYMTLGIEPTDLCGARIITETKADTDRVCEAIRGLFAIDEANSLDVRNRLQTAEFGYLSVHYVVQLSGPEVLGVPVPNAIGDRKAEIQVRTLLQHAWASIQHDRIYKTGFRVPQHLLRELARAAALLEGTDEQFGRVICALDDYKVQYGVYMNQEQLADEVEVLRAVLDNEPEPAKRIAAALRLARVHRAVGDWHGVEALLASYVDCNGNHLTEVLAEHGHALCRIHNDQPRSEFFQLGRAELEKAAEAAAGEARVRSLAYRAWASEHVPDNEHEARELYRAAFEADPKNPFHLACYVEYEVFCGESPGFRAVMTPVFVEAIETCRAYADAGIELPWAFLMMGRFHLLLEQPYESLAVYAKAVRLCLAGESCVALAALEAELAFIRRINRARPLPESHKWIRDLLLLAKSIQTKQLQPGLAPKKTEFPGPIVILAGGTATASEATIQQVREAVARAFDGFSGTIISGGTPAGVAGLAGSLAVHLRRGSPHQVEVVGYLPKSLPFGQSPDDRYTTLIGTEGYDFSARQPLQYWIDLLAAGVTPADVKVVGLDGDQISAVEYRMALAFGAGVATLEPASRAAASLLQDPDWSSDASLLPLPNDAMTLRAFISPPQPLLAADEVEALARRIHEEFLTESRCKNPDPAMSPWEELRCDLRDSNRMQAQGALGFLERVGYRVQRASGRPNIPVFAEEEVEDMAEMEHGRWVVERLRSGWRLDNQRNSAKKLSPYLVPWRQLSEEVKSYDRNAVCSWPATLAAAGLEIARHVNANSGFR
jgi:ppGpp synthetase/RelA/SpoT-type nucleotidyltranferase